MKELPKKPLPTKDDALTYAREMVPPNRWDTIEIAEGTTDDGGDGILLKPCEDCWIITYLTTGEERLWVDKSNGVVVKMVLDD